MKNLFIYPILLIVVFIFSCSDDNSVEAIFNDSKSVTDCELSATITLGTCVDGTDFAAPNEIITFAAKMFPTTSEVEDTQFLWSIIRGEMEILNVENSIDGVFAKSVVTVKFNSDFSGGLININMENEYGGGILPHPIGLE